MMKNNIFQMLANNVEFQEAICAKTILKNSGITLVEAAILVNEFASQLSYKAKKIEKLREIFARGNAMVLREERGEIFSANYDFFLKSRAHLRSRTLCEYRKIYIAILKYDASIREKKLSAFSPKFCQKLLEKAFHTSRQQYKARNILHAFFEQCVRRKVCEENPCTGIEILPASEREIVPLNIKEIQKIFSATKSLGLKECVPAIAIMLFAGIRPREMERIYFRDIDWEEKVISISATHSKTGGARHVSILPVLAKILQEYRINNTPADLSARICPPNWERKWRKIRSTAGWNTVGCPWQQDVLRHTFASYYLKYFKNVFELQCEMGHSSARLLHSRYLSMRGITFNSAKEFWSIVV